MYSQTSDKKKFMNDTHDRNVFKLKVIRKKDKKVAKTYVSTSFRFIDDVFEEYATGKYLLYEMVTKGQAHKPFVVINYDCKTMRLAKASKQHVVNKLSVDLPETMNSLGCKLTPDDIVILDASFDLTVRLLAILAPKNITYYCTHAIEEKSRSNYLAERLLDMSVDFYKDKIDMSVYQKNFNVKVIGSTEYGVTLRPIKPWTWEYMNIDKELRNRALLTYIPPYLPPAKFYAPAVVDKPPAKTVRITDEKKTAMLEMAQKCHPTAKLTSVNKAGFFSYSYSDKSEPCPISGATHEKSQFYCKEFNDGKVFVGCYHNICACSGMKYVDQISEEKVDPCNTIHINAKYLTADINFLKILWKWKKEGQVLAIKSVMGSGKTQVMMLLANDPSLKSILWVTHRLSLTNNIMGKFRQYGFNSYQDKDVDLRKANRVVVQLDSLYKVIKTDLTGQKMTCKQFDLVVIDESEGQMCHLNSPHLKKGNRSQYDYYEKLHDICKGSKRVLLMDADMGPRTIAFASNFNTQFVINDFKREQRRFEITNNIDVFFNDIISSLQTGENVVIVSMSAIAAKNAYEILSKYAKSSMMYIADTSDSRKKELVNVNEVWIKYQLLIYSPTIESGVDCTANHFHKMYCILCDSGGTCSQRSLLQMTGRVRNLASNDILMLHPKIPMLTDPNTNEKKPYLHTDYFKYEEVLENYHVYCGYLGKPLLHYERCCEVEEDQIVLGRNGKLRPIDQILLHNRVEELNKKQGPFLSVLYKLIQEAGDAVSFTYTPYPKDEDDKDIIKHVPKTNQAKEKRKALADIDVNEYEIDELVRKQASSDATTEEKLVLERYFYDTKLNTFGLTGEEIEDKLEYLDKNKYVIANATILLGYSNKLEKLRSNQDQTIDEGTRQVKYELVQDLITRFLGSKTPEFRYDAFDKPIELSKKEYDDGIEALKGSTYFLNEKHYRPIMFASKARANVQHSRQHYSQTFKSVLEKFGFLSEKTKVTINNKSTYKYTLSLNPEIHNFIKASRKNLNA